MLNHASSLLAMWRKLIKEADMTVLKTKRQQEPAKSDVWRLRFHDHKARLPRSSATTYDISLVSPLAYCYDFSFSRMA